MAPPKLDPWKSPSEWQKVYKLLYSPDQSAKREGLSFVRMWAARSQRLPLSVECTGELVAASLESGDGTAQISVYSLAIIRFVNGHIDRAQGGVFARSVASVAAEIGIPDWIIDIRHEATHKCLPSRERLRMAVDYALCWLEEKYWKPQYHCLENAKSKVQESLAGYMDLQRRLDSMKRDGKKTNKTEITLLVEQISSLSQYELSLLPIELFACLENTSFLFSTWKPLLVQLNKNKPHVLSHLIYVLCQKYSIKFEHHQKIISFFEDIISENLFGTACKDQYSLYVDILLRSRNDIPTRKLCCLILNHSSEHVTGRYAALRDLFNIHSLNPSPTLSVTCTAGDICKQVEDLKSVLHQLQSKSSNIEPDPGSRFVECDSSSWLSVPMGCTPAGINLSLEFHQPEKEFRDDFHIISPPKGDCEIEIDRVENFQSTRFITKDQLMHIASSVQILDDLD